jgi:hypothetical protein
MAVEFSLNIETTDGRIYCLWPAHDQIPSGAITENSEICFRLLGQRVNAFAVSLRVDDVLLDRNAISLGEAIWKWKVGYHAGIATIVLSGATSRPLHLEIITDPHRAKLTRIEYQLMVGDLLSDTLSLLALTGRRVELATGTGRLPPDIARFEYLRSRIEKIERAIADINRTPWRRLVRTTEEKPLGRADGATSTELAEGLRLSGRPLTTEEIEKLSSSARNLADALFGHLPRTVKKTTGRVVVTRREHADALAIMNRLHNFLKRALIGLERLPSQENESTPLETLKTKARSLIRRLDRLMVLPVFAGVTPTIGPIEPTHVFTNVPAYRTLWRAWREFLRGVANIEGNFLKVPLSRTYELYELWCFLRLARACAEVTGVKAKDLWEETADASGLRLLLKGKPLDFGQFVLLFQQSYREVWKTSGPRVGSFSREMIPDIVVELKSSAIGEGVPVIVLDAKYRVETAIDDAITSIHLYRDAIVEAEDITVGKIKRTIKAAFVITPHIPGIPVPGNWQDDKTPHVFFREEYRQIFKFGAITMRPGISVATVNALLDEILNMVM